MERETWWARLDLVAISGGFLCPYDQIDSKLAKSEKLLPTTGWSADSVSALFAFEHIPTVNQRPKSYQLSRIDDLCMPR